MQRQHIFMHALLAAVVGLSASSSRPAWAAPVPHTDIRVVQFVGAFKPTVDTHPQFVTTVSDACAVPAPPDGKELAPILAAVAGIAVDWTFGLLMNRLENNLKKQVAAYSKEYSNKPRYVDVFAPDVWSAETYPFSCIVVQRIECKMEAAAAKVPGATCARQGSLATVSAAMQLQRGPVAVRAVPLALHVNKLTAKHESGTAGIAVSLQMKAFGMREGAGFAWDSGEVVVMQAEFVPGSIAAGKGGLNPWGKIYPLESSEDRGDPYLPLPPVHQGTTHAALLVRIAEVGNSPGALKAFSKFVSDNKDDLSGAFSAAVKKKWKLTD